MNANGGSVESVDAPITILGPLGVYLMTNASEWALVIKRGKWIPLLDFPPSPLPVTPKELGWVDKG